MIYRLKRPSVADLQAWAARLSRLDTAALRTQKKDAVLERKRDAERRQASLIALPAKWRTRDKLRGPEWPPSDDLATWEAIGASHALEMRRPAITPTDRRPHACAYRAGYFTTLAGYAMPDHHPPTTAIVPVVGAVNIVDVAAGSHGMDADTLGHYITTQSVKGLSNAGRAAVLIALARYIGADPLARPFIIFDDSVYQTAECAAIVRVNRGYECSIVDGPKVVEYIEGHRLIEATATCTDPNTGRSETAKAYVPYLVEHVTEWGENASGKKYPKTKAWLEPTPQELANGLMKLETKAMRRATKPFVASGAAAIDDMSLDIDGPPHPDEAGY